MPKTSLHTFERNYHNEIQSNSFLSTEIKTKIQEKKRQDFILLITEKKSIQSLLKKKIYK